MTVPADQVPDFILQALTNENPLSRVAVNQLVALMTRTELPKGQLLFREGETGRFIYLLEKGAARAYALKEGKEITFWFGFEGAFLMPFHSYIASRPAYESIELLENSVLYAIPIRELQQLYQHSVELANWGRKLIERELMYTEERLISWQFRTATQRYIDLLEQHPHLIQRVPLGHIATYLGISGVSLSRIRNTIR